MTRLSDMFRLAVYKITTDDIGYKPTAKEDTTVQGLLNSAYYWATIVAVVVIVIAGFMYTTSQGDPNKVARAKNAILYAIVGLIIVLAAVAIVNFILATELAPSAYTKLIELASVGNDMIMLGGVL